MIPKTPPVPTHPTYEYIAKERVSKDVSATTTERRPRQAAFPKRRAIAEVRGVQKVEDLSKVQPERWEKSLKLFVFGCKCSSKCAVSLLILVACYHSKTWMSQAKDTQSWTMVFPLEKDWRTKIINSSLKKRPFLKECGVCLCLATFQPTFTGIVGCTQRTPDGKSL